MEMISKGEYKRKPPSFSVPETDLPIRENVTPGTWFARDNVFQFIQFCRLLQVMQVRVATKIFEDFGVVLCKEFIIGWEPVSIVYYTRP